MQPGRALRSIKSGGIKLRGRHSVLLGVLTTTALIWLAYSRFDIPAATILWLLLSCALAVLVIILLAALAFAGLLGYRRLRRRRDRTG